MNKRTQAEWQAIGNQVTEQRLKAGYRTIQQLADAVQISAKTLGALEAGRSVSEGTLYEVRRHLASAVSDAQEDVPEDEEDFLYQRRQGLTDEQWRAEKRRMRAVLNAMFDQAAEER